MYMDTNGKIRDKLRFRARLRFKTAYRTEARQDLCHLGYSISPSLIVPFATSHRTTQATYSDFPVGLFDLTPLAASTSV